jgi:hypothetical protein
LLVYFGLFDGLCHQLKRLTESSYNLDSPTFLTCAASKATCAPLFLLHCWLLLSPCLLCLLSLSSSCCSLLHWCGGECLAKERILGKDFVFLWVRSASIFPFMFLWSRCHFNFNNLGLDITILVIPYMPLSCNFYPVDVIVDFSQSVLR